MPLLPGLGYDAKRTLSIHVLVEYDVKDKMKMGNVHLGLVCLGISLQYWVVLLDMRHICTSFASILYAKLLAVIYPCRYFRHYLCTSGLVLLYSGIVPCTLLREAMAP